MKYFLYFFLSIITFSCLQRADEAKVYSHKNFELAKKVWADERLPRTPSDSIKLPEGIRKKFATFREKFILAIEERDSSEIEKLLYTSTNYFHTHISFNGDYQLQSSKRFSAYLADLNLKHEKNLHYSFHVPDFLFYSHEDTLKYTFIDNKFILSTGRDISIYTYHAGLLHTYKSSTIKTFSSVFTSRFLYKEMPVYITIFFVMRKGEISVYDVLIKYKHGTLPAYNPVVVPFNPL